jgi:hypothetical protein
MPQDCVWRHATSIPVMQVRNLETDVCVPYVTEKKDHADGNYVVQVTTVGC